MASETNAVVLYIDDNAELRKLMADILGKHYKFITADGGLEGLKIVKTTPVDVIICDLMMPGMDGFEFCKELKSNPQTNFIPIIMLTGLTPLDFVRNIKMKYACKLLKNKSANISDVAYTLGFSTPKYFTKTFKEVFGMTPTEFQEKDETK